MSSSNRPLDERRPFDLVCMGRVAVDLYAEQIHSPLENAQSFRKYLGGCAGNISVISRLGLKSAMFSCTGTDAMGNSASTIHHEGDTTLLRDTSGFHCLVLLGNSLPDRFPLIFYGKFVQICRFRRCRPRSTQSQGIAIYRNLSFKPFHEAWHKQQSNCQGARLCCHS